MSKPLCDEKGCTEPAALLDKKGYVYCRDHGFALKANGRQMRLLRTAELTALGKGELLRYER